MVSDILARIARAADEMARAGDELEKALKAASAKAQELDQAVFTVKDLEKKISQRSSELGALNAKHDEIRDQLAALRAKF
jgi:predicted  nucleic acid-binding Zn-ribbon protein